MGGHDDEAIDEPGGADHDRRRLLRAAGVAAGAAWAAPAVLSATPAAAGQVSAGPCAPTVTVNTFDCATGGGFSVSVPDGCPGGIPMLTEFSDGGPFQPSSCNAGVTQTGISVPPNYPLTTIMRLSWVTDCTSQTVIQSFTSVTFGPCPGQPGGTPGDGEPASGVEVTVNGRRVPGPFDGS